MDDDPVNQMVIQTMLSKAGFKVLKAADGQKALDMLEVGAGQGHLLHGMGGGERQHLLHGMDGGERQHMLHAIVQGSTWLAVQRSKQMARTPCTSSPACTALVSVV